MIGIVALLAVLSLICAVLNATAPPRCPLWVSVVLLSIAVLLTAYPK